MSYCQSMLICMETVYKHTQAEPTHPCLGNQQWRCLHKTRTRSHLQELPTHQPVSAAGGRIDRR